jgi:hypothetical protein
MPSTNPGRPANEKDLITITDGAPMFPPFPGFTFGQLIPGTATQFSYSTLTPGPGTGVLTSTGAAVNNITTATQFATGVLQSDGISRSLVGSMAGRVYLVQCLAAGSLMASDSPLVGSPSYWTVAQNNSSTVIPPAANTFPGVPMNTGDVRLLIMLPTTGWLQWISSTGTASLVCTELF